MGQYPTQERDPVAESDLATHNAATTGVHGIADTSLLVVEPQLDAEVAARQAHEADTTAVHGIADTSLLVVQANLDQLTPTRLGVNSIIAANMQVRVIAQGSGYTPLVLRHAAAPTANMLEAQDSGGNVRARIGPAGELSTIYLGATGTTPDGNVAQHLVLSTSATRPALVAKGAVSQTADLFQAQDATGTTLTAIGSGGGVRSQNVQHASGVGPWVNFAGGTGVVVENRMTTTLVPLVVKGMVSQSGDLQQWQDNAGAVLANITPGGGAYFVRLGAGGYPGAPYRLAGVAQAASDVVGLLRGAAGQTGDYLQVQDSAGSVRTRVDLNGGIASANRITAGSAATQSWAFLNVNVNTPTIVGAAIRGAPVQTANLFEAQASDGSVRLSIESGGRLLGWSRVFATTDTVGGAPLTARGMVGQTGNLFEAQDAASVVKAKIDANGYITSFTGVQAIAGSAGSVPLLAKGAASQAADLLQLQDSTSAVLARVDSTGQVNANNAGFNILRSKDSGTNRISLSSGVVAAEIQNNLATNAIGLAVRGIAGQTGDLQQWRDSTSAVLLSVDNNGTLFRPAGMLFFANTAATTGLRVKGAVGQTANLQEWQDSTNAVLAKVDSVGNLNAARLLTSGRAAFGNAAADATAQAFVAGNVATDTVLRVKGAASQTGDLFQAQNSASVALLTVTAAGQPKWASSSLVQTTVGAAGGASALPATPTKYLQVVDNTGAVLVIPAYASA